MELILKIAWRNILRHKGKSIIIGFILFVGALMMTLGNGIISGMNRGLEENIVNGFLGDIVILSDKEKSDSILMKMYGESIASFNNYKDIKKVLQKQEYLKAYLPVGKNAAMMLNEDEGEPGFAMLIGADMDAYAKFFPGNVNILEGKVLKKNEAGILVPEKAREQAYDQMNIWLLPEGGSLVEKNLSEDAKKNIKDLPVKRQEVLMGMGEDGSPSDVRIPVRGVFKYRALNTIWGHFSIMDMESYRQCMGYFAASDTVKLTKEKQKLMTLDTENLDAMFGSGDFMIADTGRADLGNVNFKKKEASVRAPADPEAGAFNLVFVKLHKSSTLDESLKKLNKTLKEANLGVRAASWKDASGMIGSMATIIKAVLFAVVLLVFVVAVIIIVNTLTMAAIERSSEIGMMRAIGAHKSFISSMFLGETAILSLVFGGAGVIAGIIIINVVPYLNITTTNDFVQLVYGGEIFNPQLSLLDIITVVAELIGVTVITVIYPVKVAKGITPLDAISRD